MLSASWSPALPWGIPELSGRGAAAFGSGVTAFRSGAAAFGSEGAAFASGAAAFASEGGATALDSDADAFACGAGADVLGPGLWVAVFCAGLLAGVCAAGALPCAAGGVEPDARVELLLDAPQAPMRRARPTPVTAGSNCGRERRRGRVLV